MASPSYIFIRIEPCCLIVNPRCMSEHNKLLFLNFGLSSDRSMRHPSLTVRREVQSLGQEKVHRVTNIVEQKASIKLSSLPIPPYEDVAAFNNITDMTDTFREPIVQQYSRCQLPSTAGPPVRCVHSEPSVTCQTIHGSTHSGPGSRSPEEAHSIVAYLESSLLIVSLALFTVSEVGRYSRPRSASFGLF